MDKSEAKDFIDDCDSVERFFTYVSLDWPDSNYSDFDPTETSDMEKAEKISSQSYSVDVGNDPGIEFIRQHRRIVFASSSDYQKSSNGLVVDSPRSSPSAPIMSSRFERHSPPIRKSSSSTSWTSSTRWNRRLSINSPRPMYKDFQLLGDSQFIRFAHHIMRYKWERKIQYCRSGQKAKDLLEVLLEAKHPIHENVCLMIGTNDLIQKTNIKTWTNIYKDLLSFLKPRTQKIILVTVPPVPKMGSQRIHWETLKMMNEFILNQRDGEHIFAVDIGKILSTNGNRTCNEYFERFYGNSDREDLIHLNRKGLRLIETLLNINYFNVE